MIKNNMTPEEFIPANDLFTSLSQLSKEQFHELMSSSHPSAKKFRKYTIKEFEYRNKSYESLNDFFRLNSII